MDDTRQAMETELKLRLEPSAMTRWRQRVLDNGGVQTQLEAVYFDTADRRLAARQMSLRLRLEGPQWVQTAKAPGDGMLSRFEREVRVAGDPSKVPALDLHMLAGSPLEQVLQDGKTALEPRFAVRVARLSLPVSTAGGTQAALALDSGHIVAGDRQLEVAEMEIEHVAGPVAGVLDIALDVVAQGGAWIGTASKAARGDRLARGEDAGALALAQPLRLPADAGGHALLRAVLLDTLAHVLPNAEAVAAGHLDDERIHQARVGLRRLRTALREFVFLQPDMRARWDAPLSTAFAALGQHRDDEAVADAVAPLLAAAGAPRVRWTPPAAVDPASALRDPAVQVALLEILRLTTTLGDAAEPTPPDVLRKLLRARLAPLARRVGKEGRRFDALCTEDQHAVRKRLKRLRYLTEFVAPLFARQQVAAYLKVLKPAQEALGAHNDVIVAADRFAAEAAAQPDAQFACGYLKGYSRSTARKARKALRTLDKATPFWSRRHG